LAQRRLHSWPSVRIPSDGADRGHLEAACEQPWLVVASGDRLVGEAGPPHLVGRAGCQCRDGEVVAGLFGAT
jgi:hypothetical protein